MNRGMFTVYVIRDLLRVLKKEMDEKGLTFDELIAAYDEAVVRLENADI